MATDFQQFAEGAQYLLTHGNGLPSTCFFLLSTDAVSSLTASSTLAGGVAEITGTGYARQSQSAPTPSGDTISFTASTWSTSTHTDWPSGTKSIILATTTDNTGKAICQWNLIAGGGSRDLSQANTTEVVTPTLTVSS